MLCLIKIYQMVQKNEIFVDLLERLTVLVASNGHVLRSHLDGSLVMRSFIGGSAGKAIFNISEYYTPLRGLWSNLVIV